jgi:hypothetical protein
MKRKLIQQGLGGVTLYLPIKWIRKRNLHAGDEVEIEEMGDSLVVGGNAKSTRKKKLYFSDTHRTLLRTTLAAHYRMGYYELEVHFEEMVPIKLLEEILQSLLGYELIERRRNSCVIRDISGDGAEPPRTLINRLFQNVNLLYDMGVEKLPQSELEAQRLNILKLRDYCQRRIIIDADSQSYELYSLVILIEKIAGEYYYFFTSGLNQDALSEPHALLKEMHTCFLKSNPQLSNKIFLKMRKYAHESNAVQQRSRADGYVNRILNNLYWMAARMQGITE